MLGSATNTFSRLLLSPPQPSSVVGGLRGSIQRSFSKLGVSISSTSDRERRQVETGNRDFLTQEEAECDIFFVLERENNVVAKVDAVRFIDYLLATGDYSDPETRAPLSEETLLRLDVFSRRLGKPSVIDARISRAQEFIAQKSTRDIIATLDTVIGECVAAMYDGIESVNEDKESVDDATVRLLTTVVPSLEEAFVQLVAVDVESARLTASAMEMFLKGPAQRPTPDKHDFLPVVLNLFHSACGQM